MDERAQRAAQIFSQYGISMDAAVRAGGWTNDVWVNRDVVLRLSKTPDSDRIRREIERAKHLPPSVGYPVCVATGVTDGCEWSLSRRISGVALSDVWAGLSWPEKSAAIRQIYRMMEGVHSIETSAIEHITLRRSWFSAFDRDESLADIERYVGRKLFTNGQGRVLRGMLERFYGRHSRITPVLNHGDITADNLMWNEGNVVSLLDFEHSAIAPPQLDLHSLVNLALLPDDAVLTAEGDSEIVRYIDEMMDLFKPLLSRQGDFDLLLGYGVLFRQRFFESALDEPEAALEQSGAYQKLLSLSDGSGGYFAKLLAPLTEQFL